MKNVERFRRFLSGEKTDRTPMIEWATWWDKTMDAWFNAGIPKMDRDSLLDYWGDDPLKQFWLATQDANCPVPKRHGAGIIEDEDDYDRLRPCLYTDNLLQTLEACLRSYSASRRDDEACWFTLDGFFWFPRNLLGIENHLFAFYDQPELMLRINRDLCDYHAKCLDIIYKYIDPVFMTFAEDMSYNGGPMLSREMYEKFMLPFYLELIPSIKSHGTRVLIDSDGQIEPLIPWFMDAGIEGILPLERMAGVDVCRIRRNYPDFILIGGFDKTTMHKGESAMRAEFERILPALRMGRFIPSVDHQTPPDVSIENYTIYRRLLAEYAAKATE